MEDQIGGKSWPQTFNADGQHFIETRDTIGFILENDVFRKAGKYCWSDQFDNGKLSMPGISLNKTLYQLIDAKHEKDFYVYDQRNDRYFHLVDREEMKEYVGVWETGDKDLKVTPVDCYRTRDEEDVPEPLKEYVKQKTGTASSRRLY